MSVQKLLTLICDGHHSGENAGVTHITSTTGNFAQLRARAKREWKWEYVNKNDYCEHCAALRRNQIDVHRFC